MAMATLASGLPWQGHGRRGDFYIHLSMDCRGGAMADVEVSTYPYTYIVGEVRFYTLEICILQVRVGFIH